MITDAELSARYELRQVRHRLTAQVADLHHVLGFIDNDGAVDEIRDAIVKVTAGAARVELALRTLISASSTEGPS